MVDIDDTDYSSIVSEDINGGSDYQDSPPPMEDGDNASETVELQPAAEETKPGKKDASDSDTKSVPTKEKPTKEDKEHKAYKEAINDILQDPLQTAVPKNKLKTSVGFKPSPLTQKAYFLLKLFLFFAAGFFLAYHAISGAYNRKVIATAPIAEYELHMGSSAVKARQMLYRGIANARKSIVAVIPSQYGLDPQLYKSIGQKARQGIKVILIVSSTDADYAGVRNYFDYYTGRKALIAAIPTTLHESIFAIDGTYFLQTSAPISSHFGKVPMQGVFSIYKDPVKVRELQRELSSLQKSFSKQ